MPLHQTILFLLPENRQNFFFDGSGITPSYFRSHMNWSLLVLSYIFSIISLENTCQIFLGTIKLWTVAPPLDKTRHLCSKFVLWKSIFLIVAQCTVHCLQLYDNKEGSSLKVMFFCLASAVHKIQSIFEWWTIKKAAFWHLDWILRTDMAKKMTFKLGFSFLISLIPLLNYYWLFL